ncbi:MAG: hypothetical protein EPGJADBJ_01556 [Saprospiraceae bacterium]|nr:hypothetical protein [Saprospiraceae bacterium]
MPKKMKQIPLFVPPLRLFLPAFFLFFFKTVALAQPAVPIESVATPNPCERTFDLEFPVWWKNYEGNDDEMDTLAISVIVPGVGTYVVFTSAFTTNSVWFPTPRPWQTSQFSPWDDNEYFTQNFPSLLTAVTVGGFPGSVPGLHTTSPGSAEAWCTYKLRFSTVPESWYGKTVTVRLVGAYDDGPDFVINQTKTMDFPAIPAPTGIQATTTICTQINVSWTKPSLPCTDNLHKYQIRYRTNPANPFGPWIDVPGNGSATSYSHTGLSPGVQYEYELRTLLVPVSGSSISGSLSDKVTGSTKALPTAPSSFTATSANCDQSVTLTWDFVSGLTSYTIYRNGTQIATPGPNVTTYTDNVPAKGVTYNYTLVANNSCGAGPSAATTGLAAPDPDKPDDVNATVVPGVGVSISWPDVDNETGYKIERSLLGGGGSSFFQVSANTTSYLDNSLVQCQIYEYRVSAFNACKPLGIVSDSVARIQLIPDLSNAFHPNTSLNASKGYFSNRVEISWTLQNPSNFINAYKIYRKPLGSPEDSTVVETLNAGSNFFIDNFTDAGVLYQYFIVAESQCGNSVIYSNVASSVGFRSPFGVVTGKVSYGGGIAVQGARISAESTSGVFGKSLSLNGTGSLKINDASTLDAAGGLLLETWIRPASYSGNFTLFEKNGSYSLKYLNVSNQYVFQVYNAAGGSTSVSMPAGEITVNHFSHIAAQAYNDTLQIFVNGIKKASQNAPAGFNVLDNAADLIIGTGYNGMLDEIRCWSIGKPAVQMKNDYSRLMHGGEAGLAVYLRANESLGASTYDLSKSGTVFNRNHAAFQGNVQWSGIIPTAAQLGAATYTDNLGNYVLNTPYHGNGEVFILTPGYLSHEFDPTTSALFIGDGSSVHVGVNFIDKSSFTVSGSLLYKNTTCGVKGATLKIDGQAVIDDGVPVKTSGDGSFTIQVPIGLHSIELEQAGHVYSTGRFPATGKYNFQEDLAGIGFVDSTLVKVVGRVVGGLREARKAPGLGQSKNNIGVARVILKSQQGNGCSTDTIFTNALTGEYVAYMPPLKYIPSVVIPSNPAIDFGVLALVDLTETLTLHTAYDTIFSSSGNIVNIDSASFHKQLDYIYRVNPEIAVFDHDGVSPFIGDSVYTYVNVVSGDTLVRNLRTQPFRWPVFSQQDDDFEYRCLIRVFEKYTNVTTGVTDSVPTTDGALHFNNELSHLPDVQVELKDVNHPDTLKTLIYAFKPGYPNFLSNTSIPAYSYTRKFEINLITGNGTAIPWLPVAPANIPVGGDAVYRAYMLGTQSNGDQFVTFGPQVPEYVLRDPPGSGSYATRDVGTTKTETAGWGWKLGGNAHTEDNIYLGAKFSIGLGVQTATEVENNTTAGFEAEISGGNSGSQSVTTTNTKSWSTHDGTDIEPGSKSDLYIGKSKNLQFGISESLAIIPNDLLDMVEPLGDPDAAGISTGFSFGKKYGLSIIPGGYQTQFMFTQLDIEELIIPNLIQLRNTMLQANPKYTSHLPLSDPNFGKNNDDPVFGNNASTVTPNTGDFEDLDGPSYTYNATNLQDSLAGDSVRVINTQIRQWEDAIRLNEWEKVNIGREDIIDSLRQVELDKLENEYKEVKEAYFTLVGANGLGGAVVIYGLIATPVPGTAFAGYATFAVTSATNIVLSELAEEYETYLAKKDRINQKFDQVSAPANYTLSGGSAFSQSISHSSAVSHTSTIEFGMSAEMLFNVEGKINGNGAGIEKGIELTYESSRDWTTEESQDESVSYTFSDNVGDLLSVDVYPSMLGWGPVFKTKPGSATSCPYEAETVTSYYEPGTVISPATLQVEKPTITVTPAIQTNIPADQAAVFNLTLGNESEVGYDQTYELKTLSSSNPFGAIVRFDGVYSQSVEVPGNSSINKVMTITKGPGSVYEYDSILVVLTSQCQYKSGSDFFTDIADSIYVSVHFLPTCTDVSLSYPENQWVLNNAFNDTMPVSIVDYNINLSDLESLRVDYKPSDESDWIILQSFLKDTSGLNDPEAAPIPTGTPFTLYDWDVSQLPDGNYDLRIVSECEFAEKTSVTHSGIIDRINPHPFGTPSPADGILSPNDEIVIRFNEAIYPGAINPAVNFDIRGVTNGTQVKHGTSLSFDGVNDYAEVTGGVALQRRDFTIEFSAKRNGTGEDAIISQGTDPNERLFIGFDANNRFVFRINDQQVSSNNSFTDNNWHYFAVSYDYEGETAQLFVADDNNSPYLANNGNTSIFPDYVGNGALLIGRNSVNGNDFFSGNLHELRIWNTARSLAEFSLHKSSLLSGSEPGLLYNWRMDEAAGILAEEHVRRRDASIEGATWQITPGGSSASFDGANDHLKVFTGDVNITSGMDFTLEFWFNSAQAGPATLFSNGTGTGLAADSLYSWNIDKDAAGLIHVKHNGIDFIATDENYFDGNWHHFALVLQRSGNLSAYVDGNLQQAIQAPVFRQLGGSHMHLGARGFMTGSVETVENRFAGILDEFRLWNTARKLFQVRRDRHHRMSGNELGLKLWFPFENYTTDPTGIPILTPTFNEQVNAASHAVTNNGGVTLDNQTPPVKIQRPVQAIAYTYSVNNDEIILTPTTSQEIIENVTLDITVEGLKDMHGNAMESPVTWIAYVDKNQVIWQDNLLGFSMMRGDALSFSTNIVNQGGSAKVFEIADVPAWLTVTPQSGTINPNSALAVAFTVDPNISVGDYTNDISLITDFNFPEQLTIELKVRAEEPAWTVNPANFENSMGIIGRLKINNVVSTDPEDMIVALVGTQVRGVAHLEYVPQMDAYLAFLDVHSNASSGEALEFRIWDASSGTIYSSVLPANLTFTSNNVIGSVANPQVFTTGGEISLDIPLNSGWNWLGFPLLPADPFNITKILETFEHTNGDQIKGQFQYANYNGNSNQWNGTLNNNNAGINPEQLYKLSTAKPGVLTMKGTVINPTTRPIALANGWNWIGFISIRNQPIAQALGNLSPYAGDVIKGKTQFATFDPTLGWIGSLKTLKPGQGFMYQSNGANTFTYPLAGMFNNLGGDPDDAIESRGPEVHHAFSTNMTLLGAINTHCAEILEDGSYAIGVFDNRGHARGFAPIEKVSDQQISYLTIGGEDNDRLGMRLLDLQTGSEVDLKYAITYEANQHFGYLDDPFPIEISDAVCAQLRKEETIPAIGFKVFPSVFTDFFFMDYQSDKKDEHARINVMNIWGQVVYTAETVLEEGPNRQQIDLSGRSLPDGLYTVELYTNGRFESLKLIKAK